MFQQLQGIFGELQKKDPSKTMLDLTEILMKVSGDIGQLKDYLDGKRVTEWTYLEDMALAQSEHTPEYRCLLTTRGREELEKRKRFLLNVASDTIMDIDN